MTTAPDDATLIEIDAAHLPAADATVLVAEKLREALDAGERFQALVRMPSDGQRARGEQATRSVRLLKELRPGLVEYCTGLAFVADTVTREAHGRAGNAGTRLWGCPTVTVADDEAARVWLAEQQEASRA